MEVVNALSDSPTSRRPAQLGVSFKTLWLLAVLAAGLAGFTAAEADEDENADALIASVVVVDSIDEIVVVGERRPSSWQLFKRLYEDPLRARIREEVRQMKILDEEFNWRVETARSTARPARLRLGYDPREHLRAAVARGEFKLPLDLIQPASLVSVGF